MSQEKCFACGDGQLLSAGLRFLAYKATEYSRKSSFGVEKLYTLAYWINDYKAYLFDKYEFYFFGIAIAL